MNTTIKQTKGLVWHIKLAVLLCVVLLLVGFKYLADDKPKLTSLLVPFYINPNFADEEAGDDDDQINAIRKGADVWHSEGQTYFQFIYAGETTNTRFQIPGDPTDEQEWLDQDKTVFVTNDLIGG